jgi:hypothetical protein
MPFFSLPGTCPAALLTPGLPLKCDFGRACLSGKPEPGATNSLTETRTIQIKQRETPAVTMTIILGTIILGIVAGRRTATIDRDLSV